MLFSMSPLAAAAAAQITTVREVMIIFIEAFEPELVGQNCLVVVSYQKD